MPVSFELLLSLQGTINKQFFDFSNGFCWIQALGTGICAVHDRMTTIQPEGIFEIIKSFTGVFITTVCYPSIRLQQDGRPQVTVTIPPVAGAGC